MKHVKIYTDGACSGNPGPGGYGVVLVYGEHRKELSAGFSMTTNNRMEVLAVVKGLEALKEPCQVTVTSDSKYVVQAIDKRWIHRWAAKNWMRTKTEAAKNADLWKQMLILLEKHQVTMKWVKGHSGHPENERCDELAVAAGKQENLPEDEGFGTTVQNDDYPLFNF